MLAATESDAGLRVVVAPVTTKAPTRGDAAVEMPAAVRKHLALGDQPSWIVASEVNSFLWPGPDIRPVRREGDGSPYYGKVPGNLLRKIRDAYRQRASVRVTPRDE